MQIVSGGARGRGGAKLAPIFHVYFAEGGWVGRVIPGADDAYSN